MKKVLIGVVIGVVLILMCAACIWNTYDSAQLMGHKVWRRKKYIKVRPNSYN